MRSDPGENTAPASVVDADGVPNLDLDSDSDGLSDATEQDADLDADGVPYRPRPDGDSGATDATEGASDDDGKRC